MTNYIGLFLVQYLVDGPTRGNTNAQATPPIPESAVLPSILPKPLQLNLGFFNHVLCNDTRLHFDE